MKKIKIVILIGIIWTIIIEVISKYKFKKKINNSEQLGKKIVLYYHILNKWLEIRQNGGDLLSFFISNKYKMIAIYGYKELGERLYDELKNSDIKVQYVIDRAADNICSEVDICTPDDILQEVDVVVVTAPYYMEEIEKELREKLNCAIISLEDVVYWFE